MNVRELKIREVRDVFETMGGQAPLHVMDILFPGEIPVTFPSDTVATDGLLLVHVTVGSGRQRIALEIHTSVLGRAFVSPAFIYLAT